jgi:hypothetical protein
MMICSTCSTEHKIPRREINSEMGHCVVCHEYHVLYPVIEPEESVSPWVRVEDRLPEGMRLVNIAYVSVSAMYVGWINGQGYWSVEPGKRATEPDLWCPIPPLPEAE